MGTAKYQGVYLVASQRIEVFFGNHPCFATIKPAFFNQWDQEWTGLAVDFTVRTKFLDALSIDVCLYGRAGADNTDFTILAYRSRFPGSRFYDVNNGQVVVCSQCLSCRTGGGIARNDNNFCSIVEEKVGVAV